MAIDIPRLAPDRLPHPEWPPVAAVGRYAVPAQRVLLVLESSGAPAALLDGLRKAAAAGASVDVFLAADRGQVLVQVDGRRLPLAGAARDAVLVLLGETAHAGSPTAAPLAAALPDVSLAARVASVDAQIQEARQHPLAAAAPVLERPPPLASVPLALPLLVNGASADEGARRLAQAVENSGWFLEHHAAQWVDGARTLEQLDNEVRQLPAALHGGDGAASEARAAAQLDALQRAALALRGQAWPGQDVDVRIEGDRHRGAGMDADGAEVFEAHLQLQMPRLGNLRVRIRVLEETVGVQIEADRAGPVAAALPQLGSALSARGLTIAGLALRQPDDAGPGATTMVHA